MKTTSDTFHSSYAIYWINVNWERLMPNILNQLERCIRSNEYKKQGIHITFCMLLRGYLLFALKLIFNLIFYFNHAKNLLL